MLPFHQLSATALAHLIRSRQVTSRQVVEAHLARIAQLNDGLNAVTCVLAESALAAADRADRVPATGPLHGVPFTIKESLDCVGSATTYGVRALKNALPYLDAPAVARLKAAGAIPLGRTNMSELGLRLCTDNPLRGRTRNPWNPGVTVGGSSGGDAAAVATGLTPLGLGNDMGGSLRVPAHCCGVVALKPTTGRIPDAASLEPQDPGMAGQAMTAVGPLARSVGDVALCLTVLAGRDLRDPRSVDAPLTGPPFPPRVALVTELPGGPIHPDALAAVQRAGALLAAAGWHVEEAVPPELPRVGEVWHKLVATDLSVMLLRSEPFLSAPVYQHAMRLCDAARLQETSNHRLHSERSRLRRAWSGFLAEYPVILGPNLATALWAPDADLDPVHGLDLIGNATRFILPGNALGLPCVALPMGVAHGLPTSVLLYADLWREDVCVAAAAALEAALGPVPPPAPLL